MDLKRYLEELFQTLIGTVKRPENTARTYCSLYRFQTLIGTVKRRIPRVKEERRRVSNPHRYGQKRRPRGWPSQPPWVSNPHRYGQKR